MHSDICSLSHLHPLGECQDALETRQTNTFFDAHACMRHEYTHTKCPRKFSQQLHIVENVGKTFYKSGK